MAIAIPVTPVIADGGACEARLVTIVLLGSCESRSDGPTTVIAQQQQQQAAGGGGGGGAASSSSSSSGSSGAGGSGGERARRGGEPTPQASAERSPTLVRGTTDRAAVRRLQGLLRGAGLNDVPLNSRYDRATRAAVRRFQRKQEIPTDPRTTVGPETWRALERRNRD